MKTTNRRLSSRLIKQFGGILAGMLILSCFLLYQLWAGILINDLDQDLMRTRQRLERLLRDIPDRAKMVAAISAVGAEEQMGCRLFIAGELVLDKSVPASTTPLADPPTTGLATGIAGMPYSLEGASGKIRAIEGPVQMAGGERGWLQLARSWTWVTQPLHQMKRLLMWGAPIVISLVLLALWLMIRHALGPLEDLTQTVAAAESATAWPRATVPRLNDEVAHLAMTYNRMLDRLEASFRGLRHFAADTSHQLRTPLTRLRADVESTLLRQRPDGDYRATLERVQEEAESMSAMVESLLALARAENRAMLQQPESVALVGLIEEVVTFAEPLQGNRTFEFEMGDCGEIAIQGDPKLLFQLFWNLFDNAFKYSHAESLVWVVISTTETAAQVVVGNTGPLPEKKDIGDLKQPFFRGTGASEKNPGAGLGLALSERIALSHGGSLQLEILAEKQIPPHRRHVVKAIPCFLVSVQLPLN